MIPSSTSWRYRLAVASRALAAIGGGYLLTALATTLLATCLPQSRAEATITATLLAFAVFCGVVIWVFAARSAWRAWVGVLAPSALCGFGLWLQGSLA